MATSGLAVLLSGLTVIASVTGIYLIHTPVLASMATGAILAVAVAVLTSTTLIPAVLATVGKAASKRSSWLHVSRRPETTQSRFWTRWVGWVMRRQWISALGATLVLVILATPAFAMTLGNSLQRQFEPTHEIRGGIAAAAQALGPGALGPIRVLVTFPDGNANGFQNTGALDAVQRKIAQGPDVATVSPPVFANDNHSALMSAVLSIDPEDPAARDTVDWLRSELPRAAPASPAVIDVGGPTALLKDFDQRVATTQPMVFVFVAFIAFVMLLISIRSVFLAFKGVLMTCLSVAAAYGSLVVVFEWGWLEALGFKPLGSLDSTIPPLVLAMTFGLSMDYEIFLLTRIRERFLQTNNTRDAVAYGVSTSARTITSAALIMIAVFVGFAFAGMPLVAQLGVACAVAIAVDATIVRLVLVPALMAMFAQWNWWLPGWLDRILPSVDFEKPLPKADIGDLVVIPEDISTMGPSGADIRNVVKSAAKLKTLAPQTITVADPLAFSGCAPLGASLSTHVKGGDEPLAALRPGARQERSDPGRTGDTLRLNGLNRRRSGESNGSGRFTCHRRSIPSPRARPPGDHVAREARGGPRCAGHGSRGRSAHGATAQSHGDHQRAAADRRPLADSHRRRNPAFEELPDHVPQQCQGLRRVCRSGRVNGDSDRGRRTGRNGPSITLENGREASGWRRNSYGDSPIHTRPTMTKNG